MRNTVRNLVIVVIVSLLALWAILPHSVLPPGMRIGKVTLGKDLGGGATLVYAVNIKPGDPPDTLSRVIEVLKRRVDPSGQLEISMIPQGNDRIEITMPLPGERVKHLKGEFEKALTDLTDTFISADDLQQWVQLPADQRPARAAELTRGDAGRLALLNSAGEAYDAMVASRTTYEAKVREITDKERQLAELEALPPELQNPDVTAALRTSIDAARAQLEPLGAAAAPQVIAYENARDAVLAGAVPPRELRAALLKSDKPVRLKDSQSGKVVQLPSPRGEALDRLRDNHPGAAADIDRVVAAWENYERERTALDDPADLVRLLHGAGVLNFRITVKPGTPADLPELHEKFAKLGPRNAGSDQARWYKINKIQGWYDDIHQLEALHADPRGYFAARGYVVEPHEGEYYMLAYDTRDNRLTEAEGNWRLTGAHQGTDPLGRPAIDFTMDPAGGNKLGALTENNIGQSMAVLLDDEVYTAPTLQGRISTSGQISGSFSAEERNYVIQVLSAGALQAKLSPEPISTSIVGPSLGKDNLIRGLEAAGLSFVAVALFMGAYYFLCGWVSVIGLAVNGLLLIGAMALQHAPFTLPGIAGIALTFGMAVDANVLIYERMREEIMAGADAKTAVRLGYHRALSAIVDGNLTNLIPCIVLGFMGTQEIKGFAIALGIGTLTTLFAQLVVTRAVLNILVDTGLVRRFNMLPLAIPAITRFLTPTIDWMRLRYFFIPASLALASTGIIVVAWQGNKLLDTEFAGGTAVTIQLKDGVKLQRDEVDSRIDAVAAKTPQLGELTKAQVIVVNPESDGITSSQFTIKTILTDAPAVQAAIVEAMGDTIDSQPKLTFDGSQTADAARAPIFPVLDDTLGSSVGNPTLGHKVAQYYGGVAIVMNNIEPQPTLQQLESRLAQVRSQPAFADAVSRQSRIIIADGTEAAVKSAVLLVHDPEISYLKDEGQWSRAFASREWELARTALTQPTTLSNVQNFGSAVARTFRAQAAISVLLATLLISIYVWVRFNSFRYSLAAMGSTLHDCLVAVGIVSLAGIAAENIPWTQQYLGFLPFKFDLVMVAAILTVLGYSINDTIVVMDRIRETRGKLPYASRTIVNDAINKTLSRTLITSTGALMSTGLLYVLGGEAVRGFAFALFLGIIAGTYSSISIAAPLVWVRRYDNLPGKPDDSSGPGALARAVTGGSNGRAAAPAGAPART